MRTGLYYLNNSGHRWVIFDETGRREQRTFETKKGKKSCLTEKKLGLRLLFSRGLDHNGKWIGFDK